MKNLHYPIDMNRVYEDAVKAIKESNIFKLAPLLLVCDMKTKVRIYIYAVYKGEKQILWRVVRSGLPFDLILKSTGKFKFDTSTPYIDSIRRGYFDIAEFMFKKGAKVPWQEILKLNDVVIYESLMMSNNDWINILTNNLEHLKSTPIEIRKKWLKYSIQDDSEFMFNLLVATGVSPNEFFSLNATPFQMAVHFGSFKVARIMLVTLPNLEIKTKGRKNLLHLLCNSNQTELFASCKKRTRLNLYISSVQERNSLADNNFDSEVLLAANPVQSLTNDFLAVIEELLAYDNLIFEKDNAGKLPIHYAANQNSLLLKKILQVAQCPNVLDSEGRTPLFYISNFECAKVLFEHGVNANVKDFEGNTAFEYLLKMSNHSAVEGIIKAFGSDVIANHIFESPKDVECLVIKFIQNKVLTPKLFHYISRRIDYKFDSYSEMLKHLIPYMLNCDTTKYVEMIGDTNINLNNEHLNGIYFIFLVVQKYMDELYCYQHTIGSLLFELYTLGIDLNKVDNKGDCILHKIYRDLIKCPHLDIIIPVLRPEIFSLQDSRGNTPLNYMFCQYGIFPLI